MELLRYKVAHQRLTGGKTKLISGYIDYVEAEFDFTPDWDGLDKWAHFTKGDVTYDVNLINDRIEKEQHLNLSEGTWEVKIHGDKNENGEVVMRITTDTAYVTVENYGEIHEGGVLPESVATAAEQVAAKAQQAVTKAEEAFAKATEVSEAAANGDFNGKDGYTPVVEIEQTYDAATDRNGLTVKVINEDGSFSIAGVKDGERGPKGEQGEQGTRGPAGIDGITYFYELEETESGVQITVTDAGGRIYATAFIQNGKDGEPGYTPKREVDYWTDEDKEEIVNETVKRVGSGGGGSGDPETKGIPAGGRAGQILRKTSDEDYDVEWADFEIPSEYGLITYDNTKTLTVS